MKYISIRLSTLKGNHKVDFNTYIKINDRMILYLRKGDNFESSRLSRLKTKKLSKMFINPDEEDSYRNYLQKNIESAYDNASGGSIQSRAEVVQGAQQANTEEVFENPQSEEKYNTAKDAAGKYVQFLMTNSKAVQSIISLNNESQSLSHHGVTVATYAVALAEKLGIDEKRTQLMALGALLHDYGHHESSLNIARPLSEFTKEELEIYWQHPQVGAKKVHDKKHFDQTVINIINQHEETINGEGPLKLTEKDIDPLALIVGTANALDRLITFEGTPRAEASKKFMIAGLGKYPLQHMKLLTEILKSMNP